MTGSKQPSSLREFGDSDARDPDVRRVYLGEDFDSGRRCRFGAEG